MLSRCLALGWNAGGVAVAPATCSLFKLVRTEHDRSMEADAYDIPDEAVARPGDHVSNWLVNVEALRGEFLLPDRCAPRTIDLGDSFVEDAKRPAPVPDGDSV